MGASEKIERLRLEEWPVTDRQAWEVALLPEDPFDASIGYAMRWAPPTRKLVEDSYGYWLGWLQDLGRLDATEGPADRVTLERIRDYLADLRRSGLADYTCAGRIKHLSDALQAIAPGRDWGAIRLASSRLHSQAKPSRDLRSRLRPADDVLQLGLDMMDAGHSQRFRAPVERAALYRDGLMIALLVLRPLRLKNFTSLTVGRHLDKRSSNWWITIRSEESKTGRAMEVEWPAVIVAGLETYLNVYRPRLLECSRKATDAKISALWVSKQGTAMCDSAIAFQIEARTREEFGEAINAHTFRHIAATTIATVDPGSSADIAGVLGHAGLRTADKHYNLARQVDAGRRYADAINAQRSKRRRPRRASTDDQPGLF